MSDPKTRTVKASEILASQCCTQAQVETVRAAGAWHSLALAELAEAVAPLVLEVTPATVRGSYGRRER
jgi:hypothetical protein